MELKFIDIEASPNRAKASIHKSGKIGFNKEAAKIMEIERRKYFKLAVNTDKDFIDTLYLVDTKDEINSIKIAKAGDYYYLNLGATLD
nr:hypothetical protein [Bacteroidota bacterium]